MGLKVVLEEMQSGDGVIIGVLQKDCDPVIETFKGSLEDAFHSACEVVGRAQGKWQTEKRNPVYKPPVEAKTETKKKDAKPKPKTETVQPSKAEELPLLAAIDEKEKGTKSKKTVGKKTGNVGEGKKTVSKKPETVTNGDKNIPKNIPSSVSSSVSVVEAAAMPDSVSADKTTAPGLYLQDGRGPYDSVQEAMDALGVPLEGRPRHNRYPRLGREWRERIILKS